MKNKKSIIAIIALALVVLVGITIAYFTSSASFINEFTTGTYKVTTTEVFESPDNWKPGEEIPKTITTTNDGTIPAAVRVSYTEQWLDGDTDITSSIDEGTAIINLDNTSDWTKEGNYYYYNYILNPNETTSSFIKSVTLNPELGDDDTECTTSNNGLIVTCEGTNPALGAKYILTITKETVQADKYKDLWDTSVSITERPPTVTILSGTKGNLQPGDEVGIGETEDFYVISSDNSENGKTILLAKYNLMVGNYLENLDNVALSPEETEGYGLQNVDAKGYNAGSNIATITFSDTAYWMDGYNLKSKYNENDTIYLDTSSENEWEWSFKYREDDSDAYPYVYDENSNIYQYISGENGYVNKLIEMGAPSTITGRILKYNEWYDENDQDFWLGDAVSNNGVFNYSSYYHAHGYYGYDYTSYEYYGIRPVIEIPTSALQ